VALIPLLAHSILQPVRRRPRLRGVARTAEKMFPVIPQPTYGQSKGNAERDLWRCLPTNNSAPPTCAMRDRATARTTEASAIDIRGEQTSAPLALTHRQGALW